MSDSFTGTATAGDVVAIGISNNILKVHTNDLLLEAMPVMRFDQFAVVRTDLTAEPGDTIVFSKYGNLTRGGALSEQTDLVRKSMNKTAIPISVTEYGNAVGLTSKFMTLSFMDEMANASVLLGRDYAIVTDMMLRDSLFSGTQTYFAGAVDEQKDITSDEVLVMSDIDNVVEILATKNVLKYVDANGEYYASYVTPHAAKSLKHDLISIKQYSYPELVFKGEIGEYNGVRFIETTNCPNGAVANTEPGYDATLVASYEYASGKTNQVDLYKTAVFGERAYGWAIALPVELREDPGLGTFGRKRGLAWYAIMGAGVINDSNIVVVISA